MPDYIHSDRGTSFLSEELTCYLRSRRICTSRTSRYNPQGDGLCERYNGIIWQSIRLRLKTLNLPITEWEVCLPDALHAIRSLLCTSTNTTPHERFLSYPRKSGCGTSIPTWLSAPGNGHMKRHVKANKYEDGVEEVELLDANPNYAHVKMRNGKEATVSLRHLAPQNGANNDLVRGGATPNIPDVTNADEHCKNGNDLVNNPDEIGDNILSHGNDNVEGFSIPLELPQHSVESNVADTGVKPVELRRSTRVIKKPDKLNL